MPFISSAELLVTPIIPKQFAPSGVPNPISVQAYFLLITNASSTPVTNAGFFFVTNINAQNTLKSLQGFFSDENGTVTKTLGFNSGSTFSQAFFTSTIQPYSTALVLFQPSLMPLVTDPDNVDFTLRGSIFVNAPSTPTVYVSPQTRGTFFKVDPQSKQITIQDERRGDIPVPAESINIPQSEASSSAKTPLSAAIESLNFDSFPNLEAALAQATHQASQQTVSASSAAPEKALATPPALSLYAQQAYSMTTFEGSKVLL